MRQYFLSAFFPRVSFGAFFCILSRALTGAFCGVLCLYLISQVIELGNVISRDQQVLARPLAQRLSTDFVVYNNSGRQPPVKDLLTERLLVEKLLRLEQLEGLISAGDGILAWRVVRHFIQTITSEMKALKLPQRQVIRRAEARALFEAIGRYIDKHYLYQRSQSLGRGLIEGVLDCDMRVFLYLSLTQQLGYKDFYYVLAPGHALVAWQRDDGEPLLWETTIGMGQEADLSHKALYRPARVKTYGDYQLARPASPLVESQMTASTAWLLSKDIDKKKNLRALALFKKSIEQFPSANHAAALVMFGSNNLATDMSSSAAYAEYAAVYPYALGAQLYKLSLVVAAADVQSQSTIMQALEHAESLLENGVMHPVLTALFERYGACWQKINAGFVQDFSRRLGKTLYPGTVFSRPRDRVAEGRAFIVVSFWFALMGAFIMIVWGFLWGVFNRKSSA